MHLRDLDQYLSDLSNNNNRAWFTMNKPRYDILRAEFLDVVTQLIHELGKFDPMVAACNPKKSILRITRDVRFSHDKRPYKPRFAAGIAPNDLRRPTKAAGPAYYFHIEDGKLLYGAGEYIPLPKRLKAIRTAIANDATGFSKVLKNKALRATYGDLAEEERLQRAPKGFDPGHPLIDYIRFKSFFVWNEVPLDMDSEKLVPQLARAMKDASALVQWLRAVEVADDE